jgi:hypothetical protein
MMNKVMEAKEAKEAKEAQCPVEDKRNVYELLGHLEDQQMSLWGMLQEIRNRQYGIDAIEPNIIDVNGYSERLMGLIDVNSQLLTLMDEFLTYF